MNVIVSNKYKEVIKTLGIEITGIIEGEYAPEVIAETYSNYYYDKLILDVTSISGYSNTDSLFVSLKKIFTFLDPNKSIILLDDLPQLNNALFYSRLVQLQIYNFTSDPNEIKTLLQTPRGYTEIAKYSDVEQTMISNAKNNTKTRVIGMKNITEHAGATTLIYMMYQELAKNYKVKCLEIDKKDFKYFYNEDMVSIAKEQLGDQFLIDQGLDVMLIDMNDFDDEMYIKEKIYLFEPSVVKLNKLMDKDKNILNKLANEKIILNRTNITLESAKQFESESKLKVFDIIRNLNERDQINPQIINLLIKLGFNKTNGGVMSVDDTERRKGLLDAFK